MLPAVEIFTLRTGGSPPANTYKAINRSTIIPKQNLPLILKTPFSLVFRGFYL